MPRGSPSPSSTWPSPPPLLPTSTPPSSNSSTTALPFSPLTPSPHSLTPSAPPTLRPSATTSSLSSPLPRSSAPLLTAPTTASTTPSPASASASSRLSSPASSQTPPSHLLTLAQAERTHTARPYLLSTVVHNVILGGLLTSPISFLSTASPLVPFVTPTAAFAPFPPEALSEPSNANLREIWWVVALLLERLRALALLAASELASALTGIADVLEAFSWEEEGGITRCLTLMVGRPTSPSCAYFLALCWLLGLALLRRGGLLPRLAHALLLLDHLPRLARASHVTCVPLGFVTAN